MVQLDNPALRKWMILSVSCVAVFMTTLDASIVNIALPAITQFYNAPLSSVEWVVMVYLLLISSMLLTYGRAGDMYGHQPIFVVGFCIFTVASVFNSIAPTIGYLIASRALQAIGGGMVLAVVQAIIAAAFAPQERGKAIGISLTFVSLGLATGPSLGGLLVNYFGWQSIFVINIPVGFIGCIWAYKILPVSKTSGQKFDIPGAGTLFVTLTTFLLAMSHGQAWGWTSNIILGLLAVTVTFFTAFIVIELKSAAPMIQIAMFNDRFFAASNMAALINYLAQYTLTFLLPFYLISQMNLPVSTAGYIISSFPVAMMISSPKAGALSDKLGFRVLTVAGMAFVGTGMLIVSLVALNPQIPFIVLGMVFVGLGSGIFQSPNNNSIMSAVPKSHMGIASGMIATMRNVGQVMGVAVSGAVFANQMVTYQYLSHPAMYAMRDTFFVAASIAYFGAIISLIRGKKSHLKDDFM